MFCPHCGNKNESSARFCKECGKPLEVKSDKSAQKTAILVLSIVLSFAAFIGIGYLIFNEISQSKNVIVVEEKKELESTEKPTPVQKPEVKINKTEPKNVSVVEKEKEKKQIIKESQSRVYTIFTETGSGSGFLYEKKGTVITNAHVVAGYQEVVLRNIKGQQTTGRVIGISDLYDIALIQVDEYAGLDPLPIETQKTEIGSEIIALGSPQGLENSASIGYLTGLNRAFVSEFQYENMYQIDAQISPGSSGGPLLDAESGKVIGINSALLTADPSFGFSIPMFSMLSLVDQWSQTPMTANEVVSVFSFYDDYVYDPAASAKAESYYEEYKSSEDYEQHSDESYAFEEYLLTDFILYFRTNYELALDYEDFYYIEDMLLYDSNAYVEMADYVAGIAGQGMVFDFTANEITGISIEMDHAVVSTFETFDFMNAAGEWSIYERYKDYVVVMDEFGAYKISEIIIYD